MELRKALKSIVALGTGATLVGATVLSALAAADLADYPAPFVKDGAFDALIVVGENAATADVLGSIDIATSLQAANTVTKALPGSATTVNVEGDAFRLDTGSDFLELDEDIDGVGITSLTDADLDALAGGTVSNSKGTSTYEETLQVADSAEVLFEADSDDADDVRAFYLVFDSGTEVFDYKVTFTPALESDIDSNDELEDIEDVKINLLGKEYKVTDADLVGANSWTLDLMAGAVEDSINIGETKTYSVGGSDYEVTLTFVDTSNAKFTVNGATTKQLSAGETEVLSDGTEIAVDEILYQSYAGGVQMVQFFLGASKIALADTDTSTDGNGASVEVGSNTVTDVTGDIRATNTSTEGKLTSLRFIYTADDDIHVPVGGKLSEAEEVDDDQMFLNFDIEFTGVSEDSDLDTIKLDGQGDDEYEIKFTNKAGDLLKVPYADVDTTASTSLGDESDDLVIAEDIAAGTGNWTNPLTTNEYFVVSDSAGKSTYLVRYKDLNAGDDTLEFEEVGSGSTVEVSYSFTNNETEAATLNLGGVDYGVYVGADVNDAPILVDLDGDGTLTEDAVPTWYTNNEAEIDVINATVFNVTSEDLDDSNVPESIRVTLNSPSSDNIDILSIALDGSTSFIANLDGESDDQNGYGVWGTLVVRNDADNGPDGLTITYPDDQTEFEVWYTSGATTSSISGGEGTYEEVVPIDVGAAVLDTEVNDFGAQNIIVVGGPCVNAAAADLLDNPADCAAGFEEGKAMVKLYERANGNVALLVAGYNADDTRRASRAVANYGDYSLSGAEVEVSGVSLTDITVSAPSMMMDDA